METAVKKISTKVMGLDHKMLSRLANEHALEDHVAVATVYGLLRGEPKRGETTFGPYVEFTGDHRAKSLVTGNEYISTRLLVPEVVQDILLNLMSEADMSKESVQYALNITVIYREPRKPGETDYTFGCAPIAEYAGEDPVKKLFSDLRTPPLIGVPTLEDRSAPDDAPALNKKKK